MPAITTAAGRRSSIPGLGALRSPARSWSAMPAMASDNADGSAWNVTTRFSRYPHHEIVHRHALHHERPGETTDSRTRARPRSAPGPTRSARRRGRIDVAGRVDKASGGIRSRFAARKLRRRPMSRHAPSSASA